MHSAASDGSRSKTNALPFVDDKIPAKILMDSASSTAATARTFFHCPLKSTIAIAFAKEAVYKGVTMGERAEAGEVRRLW